MRLEGPDKRFVELLDRIRDDRKLKTWSDDIPVKYVAVCANAIPTICHCVPCGFECYACRTQQPIHEGKCEKCNVDIVVVPDWHAWQQLCDEREQYIHRQWRACYYH